MSDSVLETDNEALGAVTEEGDRYTRPIRLDMLEGAKGLHPFQRFVFALFKKFAGQIPNPLLVMSYNRGLFGKWYAQFAERAMRESRYWKKEELELFAAYTANQLKCDY